MLSDAEYKRLQLACAQSTDASAVRDSAIIELLLQTGLRLSELARLQRHDVHLPERIKPAGEPGAVRVFGKGRRERVITLNWKACRAVSEYLKTRPAVADPHLFLTKHQRGLKPRALQVLGMVQSYLTVWQLGHQLQLGRGVIRGETDGRGRRSLCGRIAEGDQPVCRRVCHPAQVPGYTFSYTLEVYQVEHLGKEHLLLTS